LYGVIAVFTEFTHTIRYRTKISALVANKDIADNLKAGSANKNSMPNINFNQKNIPFCNLHITIICIFANSKNVNF
jgi:hypothetical protein